jgi:hypothetical protein
MEQPAMNDTTQTDLELTLAVALDFLTYVNYRTNRNLSPDITPQQWTLVYGDTAEMEARYQQEKQRS